MDGTNSEFLQDAEDILTQPLAMTFAHVLEHGVPQSWCTGVIHPIFKAGGANDPGNYRGITVTSVLAKMFAMILETRMSAWVEGQNPRAEGQAGFRKDFRTIDNVFMMNALIANARNSKRKLYCCFVDLKKAFDSVPRTTLWEVLAAKGITGDILKCIQSIYAKDEACVLTGEGLTGSFRCTTGVKQGCPASPLLFGLYLYKIEALLRGSRDANEGPILMQTMVAILLFADGIAMFSHSAQALQAQLDILHKFCQDKGLNVDVNKTKVVVFEGRKSDSPVFLYDGDVIEQVQVFNYLGLCFHATRVCPVPWSTARCRPACYKESGPALYEQTPVWPALQVALGTGWRWLSGSTFSTHATSYYQHELCTGWGLGTSVLQTRTLRRLVGGYVRPTNPKYTRAGGVVSLGLRVVEPPIVGSRPTDRLSSSTVFLIYRLPLSTPTHCWRWLNR